MGTYHTISPIRGWLPIVHTRKPAASLLLCNNFAFSTHLRYGRRFTPLAEAVGEGFFYLFSMKLYYFTITLADGLRG